MRLGRSPVIALVAIWVLVDARPALAYIDPGTGSALFYVITGVIVAAYFSIRGLYYRAMDILFRLRRSDQVCDIAIHCEDPRYEITFLPVIRGLRGRGIELTLFTMYERGEGFEPLPAGITHRAIPSGMVGYAYLNNIAAKILVTTTPQLDVMTFRRSRRVRHYVHLPHALGESRYVRPFAYDYFDSVFCCGPILKANVRRMESLREMPPKELHDIGIPHYDELLKSARTTACPKDEIVVLVAPSWGPLSMFEALGTGFVKDLATEFRVIVRPHPQMRISQPALYNEVLSLEGVEVDTSRTPAGAMSRAHILLSDISGITHEFAFIYERPVVIVDRKMAVAGLEGELLGGDSELKDRCREFIVPIQSTEMSEIATHIRRVLNADARQHITDVRSEVVYNFGSSGELAAERLVEILARVTSNSKGNYRRHFFSGQRAAGTPA